MLHCCAIGAAVLRGRTGLNADRLLARHLAYQRWLRRQAALDLYHVADRQLRPPCARPSRGAHRRLSVRARGFGLPPVEAMTCGAPILAADLTVFLEVTDSARHVHRDEAAAGAEAIADGIDRLASPENRDLERQKGLRRAERFPLASHGAATTDVYTRILADM